MPAPITVSLPAELLEVQHRWLEGTRDEQEWLYARELAAPFARLFAALPLHGAPAELPKAKALVSVLGFSWQPVALMAAWVRPEHMLVLGTEESFRQEVAGEGVLSLVTRIAGIDRDRIEKQLIDDHGEADLYQFVRDFLRRRDLPPREVYVDPTGGKKSMSASAALAGFLEGAPLVYVDYAEYHGSKRIPVAGTEYPRLLTNPLSVLGELELRDIFSAFDRSDFAEAQRMAARLATRLYEPREAECVGRLASGYHAWDRFDFARAREELLEARKAIAAFARQGRWDWATRATPTIDRNLRALEALAKLGNADTLETGIPLLLAYLSAAPRYLHGDKSAEAVLLIYAAVERFADLCLRVRYGLDDEVPDYSLIAERLDRKRYESAGKAMFGDKYVPRELSGPLMFANGAQLLAALDPDLMKERDLGRLRGLSLVRNKCQYEHGLAPKLPTKPEAEKYIEKAKELVRRVCPDLDDRIADYAFPALQVES